MIVSGSTGTFDKKMSSSFLLPKEGRTKEVSFAFTPQLRKAADLKRL
jgi:hypothetical protein